MPGSLSDWLSLLERRHPREVDLGLDRVRLVWERLGRPLPAPRSIVVAGTNGKGSTVATACALLDALGQRVGSYTTPHIHEYNERVRVGGVPAGDREFVEAFERIEAVRGDVSLSYFEFGTLAAFMILRAADLDFAVMEIGLGGRLDAVNLLDGDCAVITPIGLDHQEYLGDTREAIGVEKAGIVRPGRPLILGDREPPATVLEVARAARAPLRRIGADYDLAPRDGGARFRYGDHELDLPAPVLPGPHQYDNAATALAAVLEVVPAAISQAGVLAGGLRAVRLRGRFEQVSSAPAVWVDVGHNPLGARAVALTLARGPSAERPSRILCVLGMLADKDAAAAAAELRGDVAAWYCASLAGSRGQSGAVLAERIRATVAPAPVRAFATVADALSAALDEASADDGVLVFGSFLTADAALRALQGREQGAGTTAAA